MKFMYWLDCFDEELVIEFEEAYEMEELIETANSSYACWHSPETIEDEEDRRYVEDSCLPEYIVDCFKELDYKVKDWHIEGGEDD